jgi:hypothetical protein
MSEVQRILSLPIKSQKIPDLTSLFKKPQGTMQLRPIQSEIIYTAKLAQGLLGLVGVGEGKTLSSFLLPHVLCPNGGRALLIIPANMRQQCLKDWQTYSEHFHLPKQLELRSYEEISTSPGLLRNMAPDAIICDEVHRLKNKNSTRTKRLARYISARYKAKNPVKFVGLSGTITSTSLRDFAHLAAWALRENTPTPMSYALLERWANVIDRDARPSHADRQTMQPLVQKFGGDERTAFRRRLTSCEGVVTSLRGRPPCDLAMEERTLKNIPPMIVAAIDQVNKTYQMPDGEELNSPLEKVRVLRQMICGFYYFWNWPNGKIDKEWLETRSAWNKQTREYLKTAKEGYDSPALVKNACIRHLSGKVKEDLPMALLEAFVDWMPHSKKETPPVGARWMSNYLLEDIIEWASRQKEAPIIWYEHIAFAARLGRLTNWPIFAQGIKADKALLSVKSAIPAIVSARAHATGKNLQVWGNQLIANPLSDGARFEQLLGRCHRTGQQRPLVTATVYNHRIFAAALAQARLSARYIEETTEQEQRLNYANWTKVKI